MNRDVKDTDVEEELQRAFQVFDQDNNGTISADELRNVLKSLGEAHTDEEINDMMHEADLDRNGSIDYKEFVQLMNRK
ncbi:hypothetical protein MMC13_008051 [Lambiella insularis]|nr:hypothetical protein [Lambiella insularis]